MVLNGCEFNIYFLPENKLKKITKNQESNSNKTYFEIEREKEEDNLKFYCDNTLLLNYSSDLMEGLVGSKLYEPEDDNVSLTCSIYRYPSVISNLKLDTIKKDNIGINLVIGSSEVNFDLVSAIFLLKGYLEGNVDPVLEYKLAEYTQKINKGEITVSKNMLITPYTLFIAASYNKDRNDKNKDENDKRTNLIYRGLKILQYVEQRFKELSEKEKDVEHPLIFKSDHPFQKETEMLRSDMEKYKKDKNSICQERSIYLPTKEGEQLEKVDGLFWLQEPNCIMHKIWARMDISSPSRTGYTFTFIPGYLYKPDENKENIYKNRIIISVDPTRNVNLKNLAKQLEYEECKEERENFDNVHCWRNRDEKSRRYYEAWCDNEDPWYDGREYDFTIVDSPKKGSLLSCEKIKNIALNFTRQIITEHKTKILYPFYFDAFKYNSYCKSIESSKSFLEVELKDNTIKTYFKPYIREYFFNDLTEEKAKRKVREFSLTRFSHLELSEEIEQVLDIEDLSVILFKYGIGYLVMDIQLSKYIDEGDVEFDEYVKVIEKLTRQEYKDEVIKSFLSFFRREITIDKISLADFDDGLNFSKVYLDPSTYFPSEEKNLVYQLINPATQTKAMSVIDDYFNEFSVELCYKVTEYLVYGYSKSGGCLLILDKRNYKLTTEEKELYNEVLNKHVDTFFERDYYLFLIALHQRTSLMNFSRMMAVENFRGNKNQISRLRDIFMDFVIQGYYSQVTDDEFGMKKFEKWASAFNLEHLYEEVSSQINTLDDYNSAVRSRKIEKITGAVLPIVALHTVMGIGVINISEAAHLDQVTWIFVGVGVVLGGTIFYGYINR